MAKPDAPPFGILISSAGRRVALVRAAQEALTDLALAGEVVAVDASPRAAALSVADRGVVVPRCDTPEFVDHVLDLCHRHAIRLVVPTIDPELPVYAANADRFRAAGVEVAISSVEAVAVGADKSATNAWFSAHNFPTVPQASSEEVVARPEGWRFPLIVKPRRGSSAIGVSEVSSVVELELASRGGHFVAERIAEGHEHTVDVLVDRGGRAVCAVPRRRLEVRAGEVSKALTVRHPSLEKLATAICESLPGAYGPLNVQVFVDPDTEEMAAIEVNPRFGGGFPLTWEAGGRYLTWMIEEILGRPSTASAEGWTEGLLMLRFDDAVFLADGG